MASLLLLHSVLGKRRAEETLADVLRREGHSVLVPDLYGGACTDRYDVGFKIKDGIGEPLIEARALEAVGNMPPDTVLAGVSFGAFLLGSIWGSRPKSRGAVLIAGVAPWMTPPREGLRVTAHIARPDAFDAETEFEGWIDASGSAQVELHRYDGVGHYFLDPDLPDYDEGAADLCVSRVLGFLRSL
jgi:dienelactone hydrolase